MRIMKLRKNDAGFPIAEPVGKSKSPLFWCGAVATGHDELCILSADSSPPTAEGIYKMSPGGGKLALFFVTGDTPKTPGDVKVRVLPTIAGP